MIRERVLDLLGARVAPGVVPAGGSVSKLLYSDHARLTADAATKLLGAAAAVADDDDAAPWVDRLLFAPGLRIGGGTDEIQRNTIGEQGLGLPREPRPPPPAERGRVGRALSRTQASPPAVASPSPRGRPVGVTGPGGR